MHFQYNIIKVLQKVAKSYLVKIFKNKDFNYYNNYY